MSSNIMLSLEDAVKNGWSVDDVMKEFNKVFSSVHYPPFEYFATLLMCSAVRCGRVDLLDRLIASGYDVNYTFDSSIETPLFLAVVREHIAIVEMLLNAGASVTIESRGRLRDDCIVTCTPVEAACAVSNLSILKLLIKLYDRNQTRNRYTALHMTCKQSSIRCLQFLLNDEMARQYAGDVNDVDSDDRHQPDGFTPLMFAARNSSELTRELLIHGASATHRTSRTHTTALHEAVKGMKTFSRNFVSPDLPLTVDLLLCAGCEVNATDTNKCTPLALLASQASVLRRGVSDYTYPYEVNRHRIAVLNATELLIRSGANLNVNLPIANPLYVIIRDLSSVLDALVHRYSGTVNMAYTTDGYSIAVHLESGCSALTLGRDFVEMLLKYGANPLQIYNNAQVKRKDEIPSYVIFQQFVQTVSRKAGLSEHKTQWIALVDLLLDILRLLLLAGAEFGEAEWHCCGNSVKDHAVKLGMMISIEKIVQIRKLVREEMSMEEFHRRMNTPFSLKRICGRVIGCSMGRRCLTDVDKLGLPRPVQRFVLGL